MKLHRFIGQFDFKQSRIRVFDAELLNQWRNVLRFKEGDEFILCDGANHDARVRVFEIEKDVAELEVCEVMVNERASRRRVTLYCAVLKRENFEMVVQKATEVGVSEIVPILSERTVKLHLRADRLEKIIKEAAEQSGGGVVPFLREPLPFFEAASHAQRNEANFFCDETGVPFSMKSGMQDKVVKIGVFIGPEGGWTDEERRVASDNRFDLVSLGRLTLRAETAAVVASYLFTQ